MMMLTNALMDLELKNGEHGFYETPAAKNSRHESFPVTSKMTCKA